VFGAAAAVGAAAAIAVAAILLVSGGTPAASPTPLASNITAEQAVGLANLGRPPAGAQTLLSEPQSHGPLMFTPGSGDDTVQPSQQWQADQMGGGAYILVYTPDGQCLTAAATTHGAAALLAACHLGLSQRWNHPYLGTDSAGGGYYQLRSMANGRCLAVGSTLADLDVGMTMEPCSSAMPWQQLITFFTAF